MPQEEAAGKGWQKKEGFAVSGEEVPGGSKETVSPGQVWAISRCAWEGEEGKCQGRAGEEFVVLGGFCLK